MDRPLFIKIAGGILILLAAYIVLSLISGTGLVIAGTTIPTWMGLIAAAIAVYLAWSLWWL